MKEEEETFEKKQQQLFGQFSPVEGSTKTFPPNLLENPQNTPTNTYSQSMSEAGSSSSWTPQFAFPIQKSKIKNSEVDPFLKESRFAKLMELLSRKENIKEELSRKVSLAKLRNYSLNVVKQKIDSESSDKELPFLSEAEIGGGELARQKRKGVGEEPKLRKETRVEPKLRKSTWEEPKERKETGKEPKQIKETREGFTTRKVPPGEEAKKRRSAAPPEEDGFNQIAFRENQNKNLEIFAHDDNSQYYNVNHRDIVDYVNAKRNDLEEDESNEDEMRGSNSLLRMSHLLPPAGSNKKQVETLS